MTIVYMNPAYSNTPKKRLCDFINYKLDQLIISHERSQLGDIYMSGAFTEGTPGSIARFEHLRMGEGVPPDHTLPRTNDQVEMIDLKIVRQSMSFIAQAIYGSFSGAEDPGFGWALYLNGQTAYNKTAVVAAINLIGQQSSRPLDFEAEDIVRISDVYDGPLLQYHVAELRSDHPLVYGQFRFTVLTESPGQP